MISDSVAYISNRRWLGICKDQYKVLCNYNLPNIVCNLNMSAFKSTFLHSSYLLLPHKPTKVLIHEKIYTQEVGILELYVTLSITAHISESANKINNSASTYSDMHKDRELFKLSSV